MRQSSQVVVVNGLGGIGKTTLTKAWIQQVLAGYDHFVWIEVSDNKDNTTQGTAKFLEAVAYHPDLALNLRLAFSEKEPIESRFHKIMNTLRQLKGHNLLVVDNAGLELEQKAIREQLPLPPDWHVLLSARSGLRGYEPLRLDRLSPEYATQLFCMHYSGPCPAPELQKLLQEIDYHTLTVELLAKTLENHLGSLSVQELTAKLERRELNDEALQRTIALNHSREETEVYLHLLTCFDVAGLKEEECLLLAQMAALPPGGNYAATDLEEWLQIQLENRRHLQETLVLLERKGWLIRHADQSFSLHRMIQQAVLYQLKPRLEALVVLVDTFTQKLQADVSTNFTLLFQWIPFAEQLLLVLPESERTHEKVSILMNNLGVVFRNLGQYERARDLLEATLQAELKNFGPGHPNVARSQSNLANIYSDLGQYERAGDLLEAALQADLKNFGPDHPNVAVRQSNLGNVYSNLAQYERACELLEAALQSDLKNFGPDHPNVTVSQSNLAIVYGNLGQYERARELLEAALLANLKNFGPDHPNVAVSQINLGAVYFDTQEKEKAKGLFQQAYTLRQKTLGEAHPKTKNAKEWLDVV